MAVPMWRNAKTLATTRDTQNKRGKAKGKGKTSSVDPPPALNPTAILSR